MKDIIKAINTNKMNEYNSIEEAFSASSYSSKKYNNLIGKVKGARIVDYSFVKNMLILFLSNSVNLKVFIVNENVDIALYDGVKESAFIGFPDTINIIFSEKENYAWQLREMLEEMIGSRVGSINLTDGMVFINIENIGTVCFSVIFSLDLPDGKLLFFNEA